MGLVLYRSIRRKNEEVLWPHIPQRYRAGFYQASQWADLEGLEDVHRGRNLEVKPFAIAGAQKFAEEPETDVLRDIGVDVSTRSPPTSRSISPGTRTSPRSRRTTLR